jgi:peptidyl-prolyl cis-trans isomerase C
MKKRLASVLAVLIVALPVPILASSPALLKAPGIEVTTDEVLAEATQRLPANVRAKALAEPKNVMTLATDIAMRRALAAEAEKAGLDKDPKVALQLRLAHERVLAEARLAQIDGQTPDRAALEKAAQAEYRLQTDSFVVPEQIRVRHILIDARSCDAEKRIAELRAKALAGADFAALAREYSQDPGSAKKGGDLGFFERGRMAAEFDKAAFALAKPGDISEVIQTQFGYHVIVLEERKEATRQPFDKVRETMVQDLINREIRNRRRIATEGISQTFQLNEAAVEALTKQPQ